MQFELFLGLLCCYFHLSRPTVIFYHLGLLVDEIWAINHRNYIQSKLVVSNGNVRTANCRENNTLLSLYRPVCGQYSYGLIQKLDLVVWIRWRSIFYTSQKVYLGVLFIFSQNDCQEVCTNWDPIDVHNSPKSQVKYLVNDLNFIIENNI